jgi:ectoine hydroxylase-related dioxygenase (phytanoyl-CoA dioxygenase family)
MLSGSQIEAHLDEIATTGCTLLEDAIAPEIVAGLVEGIDRIERDHGLQVARTSFEGFNTLRINNLLAYDEVFWQVPIHEDVLALAEGMLDDELLLSSLVSLVLGPGQEAQPIHADTQQIPLARANTPITINAIWALSDFTADNGATRFVPGSHMNDDPPEYGKRYEAVPATMVSGSVLLIDSRLWHGAGANVTDQRRYGFSCSYCWGWMRQQENLQLGIPRATAIRFPRRLQELCGYSIYKGQFGHIDNRDPIELLGQTGRPTVWESTDIALARRGGRA